MLACTLTPLRRFCYVTNTAFVEGARCSTLNSCAILSALHFHVFLSVNALRPLVYRKYEVFNTEVLRMRLGTHG